MTDFQATHDQRLAQQRTEAVTHIRTVAVMAGAFREALIEAGFSHDEANGFVYMWMSNVVAK